MWLFSKQTLWNVCTGQSFSVVYFLHHIFICLAEFLYDMKKRNNRGRIREIYLDYRGFILLCYGAMLPSRLMAWEMSQRGQHREILECKLNQIHSVYKNTVNSYSKCTLKEQKVLIPIKSISNVPITLMCKWQTRQRKDPVCQSLYISSWRKEVVLPIFSRFYLATYAPLTW